MEGCQAAEEEADHPVVGLRAAADLVGHTGSVRSSEAEAGMDLEDLGGQVDLAVVVADHHPLHLHPLQVVERYRAILPLKAVGLYKVWLKA